MRMQYHSLEHLATSWGHSGHTRGHQNGVRLPNTSRRGRLYAWHQRRRGDSRGSHGPAFRGDDWRLHRSGPRLSNHGRGAQDRRHLVHERCRTPLLLCKLEHTRRGNNYTSGEEEKERKEKGKGTYAASIT